MKPTDEDIEKYANNRWPPQPGKHWVRTLRNARVILTLPYGTPDIPNEELQNILRIDIREELNTDYSIIFETKIELK